jgi:hypothetical protein
MKCARVGCECDAVALPELQIPAVGYTFEAAVPLSMTLALPMCAAHMTTARLSPDDLITRELRDTLDSFTSLRRKAAPDYARVRVLARRIDAPELAAFVARTLSPH